jgi:hypothetical protein
MVAKAGRIIAIRKPRARTGVVKKTSSVGGHKAPRAAFVHVQMNIYRRLAVESNTATAAFVSLECQTDTREGPRSHP